ncbi:aldo-keto reductase family 1 member B1-like isoform X1 [Neodiprion pinetum]|uniref:Aldo-keto reductase family 1 member B1-like isoform X1 n=1 Tax=Neodiprion lecontei TaxID=441921 RepID=A0ABM3GHX5_NEOLC|nr:aldo-keto reductase family 1 member B1-like isoform X1 [Neodiprion pinetum]XP_046489173.1 aldo-keto reductase family 1 member B1-like isoform X1 [Neodiprion pinetum]XP_046489174.1 aldo-keto reductase family 1 member B1-like isoform X1 [Neodiprion pinetum]XP_046489175.1 aldo-keto reductase family 1 member B1-like isoform X1 [Neodiprion pinetum]XP_046489176.1 aldo-keto reductase family 1 member B1-like isoform X1 [Neodiprion pinetum]XP_046489177.1 aldo-keto reductase family 1 member B1-like i
MIVQCPNHDVPFRHFYVDETRRLRNIERGAEARGQCSWTCEMIYDVSPIKPKGESSTGGTSRNLPIAFHASKPNEVTQAVKDAIDIGYRHIDGAHLYANEKEIGEAVRAKIQQGVIKREDIFITGKLWNTFHRPGAVEPSLRRTLEDLGVEYIDLYLIHWPMSYKEGSNFQPKDANGKLVYADYDYVDTWKAMEEVYEKGLVKNIGVSNFNEEQLERVLKAGKIKPVTNQIECQPYLGQFKLSEYCKSKGIVVTAFRPLGRPDSTVIKKGEPTLLEDNRIIRLSKKYNKTPAQVLLRYQIDRGHVVIPKSVSKSRLKENFDIFDFELSKEDVELINSCDCNKRFCPMSDAIDSPYFPFRD